MKNITLSFVFLFIATAALAQKVSFNYQGIARDKNEQPYKGTDDEPLKVNIRIVNGAGQEVYAEHFEGVRTNSLGIFNLRIGEGEDPSGSLADLNWSSDGPFDLKVSIAAGVAVSRDLSPSRLVFVPFAIYAAKAGELEGNLEGDINGKFNDNKINPGAVNTLELADNAVTTEKIAANAVGNSDLSPDAVTTDKIAANAVTNSDIMNGSVDNSKLANDAVTTEKITANGVTNTDIVNGAIDENKLSNNAVTSQKLASMGAQPGQVLKWNGNWVPANDDMATASSLNASGDVSGPLTNLNIGAGVVGSAELGIMGATNGNFLRWYGSTWSAAGELTVENGEMNVNGIPLRVHRPIYADGIAGFMPQTAKQYLWTGWTYSNDSTGKPEWNKYCNNCADNWWDNIGYNEYDKFGNFDERLAIVASKGISTTFIVFHSDKRIKENLERRIPEEDIKLISQLSVLNFEYKDKIKNGLLKNTGFIAQEVEKIIPEAVSRTTNFIPDIYQPARKVAYNPDNKTLSLKVDSITGGLQAGDKLRIIADEPREVTVSRVDGTNITVKDWPLAATTEAFVYGKQVNDFRVVDYDRIFTLNVSATQALIAESESQKARIAALEEQNRLLLLQNETQQKQFQQLEASMRQLAGRLDQADTPKDSTGKK